jgi:ribosome recycling factor
MATAKVNLQDLRKRMDGAFAALKGEFGGLRTGRASTGLVEHLMVDAYGASMPMNQIGTIGVPEPRTISIQVWDRGLIGAAERAIRDSSLGVNPVVDGTLIRIPIPPLTQERRVELRKLAGKYAEHARVAVRNVRREGMESVKKTEHASEDEQKRLLDQIQKLTDEEIKRIDDALNAKEAEIMQV